MSNIIHLLPDSIANQIAAGEVIQRPSSILKELVENALDAGATRIVIEVEDAGKALLKVTDNGKGMSRLDARMAFERHATSKISEVNDLFALQSMGFRGEALASIASVAQVELTTRQQTDDLATFLQLNGAEVVNTESVSAPVGSSFVVRNIFFNIPARRRFLKSNPTEMRHLIEQFQRIVLVYPEVSFALYNEGSLVVDLPTGSPRMRIANTLGKAAEKGLIAIDFPNEIVSITGFVSPPELAKKRGAEQYFFVNGRFMRHPYFHKAILTVYEKMLSPGYAPNYFLYFTIDPSRIDVNIHPTKTEIKFLDEQTIFKLLTIAIRQSLSQAAAIPTIDFEQRQVIDIPIYSGPESHNLPTPAITTDPAYNPFSVSGSSFSRSWQPSHKTSSHTRPRADWQTMLKAFEENATHNTSTQGKQALFSQEELPAQETPSKDSLLDTQTPILCQNKWLVQTTQEGICIVHIRRAIQRVVYQRTVEQLSQIDTLSARKLLFPELCHFSLKDTASVESLLKDLEAIGFEFSSLGDGSYSLLSVPEVVPTGGERALVEQVIAEAIEKGLSTNTLLIEALAGNIADNTTTDTLPHGIHTHQELLQQLVSLPNYAYNARGLRVVHFIAADELARFFS